MLKINRQITFQEIVLIGLGFVVILFELTLTQVSVFISLSFLFSKFQCEFKICEKSSPLLNKIQIWNVLDHLGERPLLRSGEDALVLGPSAVCRLGVGVGVCADIYTHPVLCVQNLY